MLSSLLYLLLVPRTVSGTQRCLIKICWVNEWWMCMLTRNHMNYQALEIEHVRKYSCRLTASCSLTVLIHYHLLILSVSFISNFLKLVKKWMGSGLRSFDYNCYVRIKHLPQSGRCLLKREGDKHSNRRSADSVSYYLLACTWLLS